MALRYLEIKQCILKETESLEPHKRLPSRPNLCEQYLVTRTTIDRAISELISEGYLYSVNGSGTYVADFTANSVSIRRDALNIGVLLPNILHDTYPGIIRGIEDVMHNRNINVVLCNTDENQEKQNSYLQRLLNSKVNGIVMIPTVHKDFKEDFQLYEMLNNTATPIVLCNRRIGGINRPFVASNDFYGGFIATRHLLNQGYKRIAYLANTRYTVSLDRYQGYMAALWESNCVLDPNIVIINASADHIPDGYEMMHELIARTDNIDAVFCFNDRIALGAIRAIKERGLHVSDDIGVIGYDNTEACDILPEKLTSVSFMTYEIGSKAAQVLLSLIDYPERQTDYSHIYEPRLYLRESCLGKHM